MSDTPAGSFDLTTCSPRRSKVKKPGPYFGHEPAAEMRPSGRTSAQRHTPVVRNAAASSSGVPRPSTVVVNSRTGPSPVSRLGPVRSEIDVPSASHFGCTPNEVSLRSAPPSAGTR